MKHSVRNHKPSLHINSKWRRALFLQVTLRTIGIDSTRAPVLWPRGFDLQGRRMQLNAYALDFYKHGSLTGLVQDNRCVLSVSVSISLPSHPQHPRHLRHLRHLRHPQHPHLYLCLYLSLSFSPLPLSLSVISTSVSTSSSISISISICIFTSNKWM